MAAERGIALSIHAPYFAILTSGDPEKAKQTRAALEHSLKLGRVMGAGTVVVHAGYVKDRAPDELHELAARGLEVIEPKVRHLGVALGLEVGGSARAFGTLGDIALIAARFSFVRPVVDWAHVHAMSGGSLTSVEAFRAVFAFLRENFAGWAIDPLHCQFSDNLFGAEGEIRHAAYGEGSLRVGPLVEAAAADGVRVTLVSEARDPDSHAAIQAEVEAIRRAVTAAVPEAGTRPVASGAIEMPAPLRATEIDGVLCILPLQ